MTTPSIQVGDLVYSIFGHATRKSTSPEYAKRFDQRRSIGLVIEVKENNGESVLIVEWLAADHVDGEEHFASKYLKKL
jgi:hypothetical protein